MILEKSLHPPLPIIDPSEEGVNRALRAYRGCIRTKKLEVGTHDATDHRWEPPTHHWIVQVLANHEAELRILPKDAKGLVADLHQKIDRTTVRHQINRNSRSAILGGESLVPVTQGLIFKGPVLYKIIEYKPEAALTPQTA